MSIWLAYFLLTYFTIQLIFVTIQLIFVTIHGPTTLFDTIHEFHCTISTNIYLYLQYLQ